MRMSRRQLLGGLAATGAAVTLTSVAIANGGEDTSRSRAERGRPDTEPVRLELPRPTGPHPVGVTELHLVDRTRRQPGWSGAGKQFRELMAGVWYPAARDGDAPAAPYMAPRAAAVFGAGAAKILKLERGDIDWAGFTTHARTGADVAPGRTRRPVVLHAPGMYNERTLDTTAVTELASHGYVVVTVDAPYETHAVEFPGGRVVEPAPGLGAIEPVSRRNKAALDVRIADIRFVLDRVEALARGRTPKEPHSLPRGLAAALDASRIGMFGHSLGGMATAEAMRLDRRIRAGVNLDGPLGYDWADPGELLPVARTGLDRPFLQMGAWLTTDDSRRPHTHRHSPSWRAMWRNSTGWKRDLWTEAAEHNSFTDYQTMLPGLDERFTLPDGLTANMIGGVDPRRFTASRRAYLTAFFEQHLHGRHQRLFDGPSSRHPDVRFID
ncbi:alpha/beta hydrolase family protein [Streptomyces sp. NEAU-Y11]|uniref:alpha/beta hydrolase family protein n=1 Tax=Streptomyces cucumeris TaxID=2962890 RepID=UPI0020C8B7C2|nr:lipase [Streptomyces sp. NEAU-Y11]MCP9212918.1 lipase [Streptomyces sp. NEAU-Y11]